jgi:hypothetical protein
VLDVYIQKHLKSTQAHTHLIACLSRIFGKIDAPQSFKLVMPTLKVRLDWSKLPILTLILQSFEYIFKFMTVSYINFTNTKPYKTPDSSFKTHILDIFSAFNNLMKKTEREFIGAQTVALKNFISIFGDLEKIFSITERSKIASDFINCVAYDESRKLLNMEKLALMYNLVESDLFLHEGSFI